MESKVVKESNDVHLQKPPKIDKKEEREASPSSLQEIQILNSKPAGMDCYDPNRIPASVFSTKIGPEWSGASSESLFSIQMGNNSFSNDYAIMYGKSGDFDVNNNPQLKSGELPRLEERSNNNRYAPGKFNELTSLAPVMEQEEGSLQSGESSRIEKKDGSPYINQSPTDSGGGGGGGTDTAFRPLVSPQPSNPRISDVSAHSNKSFAFPVLTSDSGKKERSIKVASQNNERGSPEQAIAEQTRMQVETETETDAGAQVQLSAQKPNKWFSCFSCPRCC